MVDGGETMHAGEIVAEKRKARMLTQTQLGEKCGYHGRTAEVTVQNWESGRRPVPVKKMKLIAGILDIPVDQLLPL